MTWVKAAGAYLLRVSRVINDFKPFWKTLWERPLYVSNCCTVIILNFISRRRRRNFPCMCSLFSWWITWTYAYTILVCWSTSRHTHDAAVILFTYSNSSSTSCFSSRVASSYADRSTSFVNNLLTIAYTTYRDFIPIAFLCVPYKIWALYIASESSVRKY